jgi:hypothetical protein
MHGENLGAPMASLGLAYTLALLKSQGYAEDFNLIENDAHDRKSKFHAFANEYSVEKVFRFDEMSDPAVLFVVHSRTTGAKGTLLNSFGAYADAAYDEMIAALERKDRELHVGKKF